MNHLIFDFDGVLADTKNMWLDVIQEVDGKTRAEAMATIDMYSTKSVTTRDMDISDQVLVGAKDWNRRAGQIAAQKEFGLFNEFIAEIGKIPDSKLAVVSSGSAAYVKPRVEKSGLSFTHILGFESHHSKEEKVEIVCTDWKVTVKDIYFFTDTIADIEELENLLDRDKIYGCAWGFHGREKLATSLDKNHILENFSDIGKIFTAS